MQRVPVHPAMALVFDQHRALITTHAVGAAVAAHAAVRGAAEAGCAGVAGGAR